MLNENDTIEEVKSEVLYHVAKAAFEGNLEKIEATLPYEILPGSKPSYRCCVYKEREIIRERIMLAKNINPATGDDCNNTVVILPAACENCPITRFSVTDNCQKCMGKKCMQACKFDAITMTRTKAYIDPNKCRECGQCFDACPYNAIVDIMRPCRRACPVDAIQASEEDGTVSINEEKCIRCGACINSCPFGAISDSSRIVEIIDHLKSDKPVYAMVAPAAEGQFGADITMESIRDGVKQLGFKDMVDVAIGADFVSDSEAREWAEAYNEGKKMTTSCCPAFVHMIRRHFPSLAENISTTVSPMAATARLVRAMDPDAVCIFIGPCIAKKSEAGQDQAYPGENADLAMTFEELRAMLRAKEVQLQPVSIGEQNGSVYGKRYGNAGGVTNAVQQALSEQGKDISVNVHRCNGASECKKALMLMKAGKLPEDFIEGMCCEGGCVSGPGNIQDERSFKRERDKQIKEADDRGILDTLREYSQYDFSMHRRKTEETR
ncbi:MAG: 4Fe-4S binding protein [Eubacterium sp.]|jgi:Iron only hydrogenase large subunit, C-terminal domain|nr:4Fe-4S binding protein [Eubacterium sp.]